MREQTIIVEDEVPLSAVLTLPGEASPEAPVPACLLLGGTRASSELALGAQGFVDPCQHRLLWCIAHALAQRGIASLRLCNRSSGVGEEVACADAASDLTVAIAAFRRLQRYPGIDATRVGLIGHSAGARQACLLCRAIRDVAGVALLAPLSGPVEEFVRWNWKRLARHWDEFSVAQRQWLKRERPAEIVGAFCVEEVIAAARRGVETVQGEAQGLVVTFQTDLLRQEMAEPAAAAFRYVKSPALLLQGSDDTDLDSEDSFRAYRALLDAGNARAGVFIVPGVDHYFQPVHADRFSRVWARVSLNGAQQPVSALALEVLTAWATQTFGACLPGSDVWPYAVDRPGLLVEHRTVVG